MEQRYFVGVDGGGTKTAIVACTPDGGEVASAVCGPLNYNFIGIDAALGNLRSGIAALALPAGSITAVGIGDPSIDDTSDSPMAKEFSKRAAVALGVPVYIRSDAFMTLFALTGGKKAGVLIISGTGSMAIGENDAHNTAVVGGWGRITGDEGSGYYIGREGVCAALRAADGVAETTALTAAALSHFGVCAPRDLISVFYGEREPDIAGFSRSVAECAKNGDKIAEAILLDAAAHLARYALVLQKQCQTDLIGVWGSVLCKNDIVRHAFEDAVRKENPNIEIREPDISAQLAAALYAVKQEKERDAK